MSAAGLISIGGSGAVGHGVMERALRIVPGAKYHRYVFFCFPLDALLSETHARRG